MDEAGGDAGTARRVPPPGRRQLVETPAALEVLAARLAGSTELAVDLETAFAPRESRQRFALLQLAAGEDAWAVDPLRLPDLSPLAPVFADRAVVKVFLAMGGDAPFLEAAGLPVRGICDVAEVGRSAFGRRGEGLQALVDRVFGVVMDKSLQRSDWLRRPLTAPLLAYAYRDAELTLALYHYFRAAYPALVQLHTTNLARATLPPGLPDWLVAILEGRRAGDRRLAADVLVEAAGLDPRADAPALLAAVTAVLPAIVEVRQRARLLDAIGELDLYELTPDLIAELEAPSAVLRFSAARALGRLGEEDAVAALEQHAQHDPVPDVREAAVRALRAIREQAQEREQEQGGS